MFEHSVSKQSVLDVLSNSKAIAEYPTDQSYPSVLLLGWVGKRAVHVVVAHSITDYASYVITAYYPLSELWSERLSSQEENMKCAICKHGDTSAGMTTVTLTRGEATVVIKKVPAEICDNSGEFYLDDAVSQHVLTIGERVIENAAELEVVLYAV